MAKQVFFILFYGTAIHIYTIIKVKLAILTSDTLHRLYYKLHIQLITFYNIKLQYLAMKPHQP